MTQTSPHHPNDYIAQLPPERQEVMQKLRTTILENLPEGYIEEMSYGMIGFVVPHSLYPKGYHCDPKLPLPFISLASQKNFIALYHMGLYADENLLKWFQETYHQHSKAKLDMGKSCIRFKKINDIPFALIAELVQKMSVQDWVKIYEFNYLNK